MSLAAKKPAPSAAASQAGGAPLKRALRKGELLFAEGENSRAMFLLGRGMVRIFKKKGTSQIEIDTIHSGQILGELAFLDGNPRSASAEALTDCELVEVSAETFTATLGKMPDWLKLLMKTIVGRLRTASTRIRQLESTNMAVDYSTKDGKRSSTYMYLSPIEVMKISTALLLVAARNGQKDEKTNAIEIRIGLLQRYANQIMGVPVAKITTLVDVFAQVGLVAVAEEGASSTVKLMDIDFLERCVAYLNEENLLEASKRHDVTLKGFIIMSAIAKYLGQYPKDEATGTATVNVAKIAEDEKAANSGRETYRLDEFPELVKLGYASNVNIKSSTEAFTTIDVAKFKMAYKIQRVIKAIEAVNEQKREKS